MTKVWVTGAAGLLGRWTCKRLLARGDSVVAVDNRSRYTLFADDRKQPWPAELSHPKCLRVEESFYSDDALELLREERPDAVVHCAAQTSHPRSFSIENLDFETNAVGTRRLLASFEALGRGRFVLVSTAKIYGEHVRPPVLEEREKRFHGRIYREFGGSGNEGFDGDDLTGDLEGTNEACKVGDQTVLTPFGISKLTADLYAQHYGRRTPDGRGNDVAILRPGCFTAPGSLAVREQNWEPMLTRAMTCGDVFEVYGYQGKQVRDVLHADDLALAILACLDRAQPFHGDVFNVAGGRGNEVSILEAVDLIHRFTGKRGELVFREKRQGDWCFYIGSNRKITGALGWTPRIGVAETFRQLCEETTSA